MTNRERSFIFILAWVVLFIFLGLMGIGVATAGGNHNDTTYITNNHNYYQSQTSLNLSIPSELINGVLAGGSHQFDWITTRWQFSITASMMTSDWDEDAKFSFAFAKKFGEDSWVPNALYHASYTPDIDGEDFVHGGATIPLGN